MLIKTEIVALHRLQSELALRRDWVAVGHLQNLINHIADEHGFMDSRQAGMDTDLVLH